MIRRHRPGALRLARVEVTAFGDSPMCRAQWPVARRFGLWLNMAVNLFVLERRSAEDGTAVCLLGRLSPAVVLRGLSLTVGFLFIGAVLVAWAPISALGFVVLGLFLCLPTWRLRRLSAPARAVLAQSAPGPDWVEVHSVASVSPGAGRQLLEALCVEADDRAWTLYLDAGNLRLVDYYAALGFEAVSDAAVMPWGEAVTRMVRPAQVMMEVAA